MSPKKRARSFFHGKLGRVPSDGQIASLAEIIVDAEQRGARRVLDLLARRSMAIANAVAEELAQSSSITPIDDRAQSAEHGADQDRLTVPGRA